MATTVKDFVGRWRVRWVKGENPYLVEGWWLDLGTGSENGDVAPFLDRNYQTCLGFAVVDEKGTVVLSSSDRGELGEPLAFLFADGTLRFTGLDDGVPLRLDISFAKTESPDGQTTYTSLYGSTTYGDPDQVAVWGADGTGSRPDPK